MTEKLWWPPIRLLNCRIKTPVDKHAVSKFILPDTTWFRCHSTTQLHICRLHSTYICHISSIPNLTFRICIPIWSVPASTIINCNQYYLLKTNIFFLLNSLQSINHSSMALLSRVQYNSSWLIYYSVFGSFRKEIMGSITDATILHHVCIVLLLLWFLNSFNYSHPLAYFLSLIYLYLVS